MAPDTAVSIAEDVRSGARSARDVLDAHLAAIGRARYEQVTDAEVLDAFTLLSRMEGIIPALEPAHALAWVVRAKDSLAGQTVLLNLSGRGDKDVDQVMGILG